MTSRIFTRAVVTRLLAALCLSLTFAAASWAVEPEEQLPDPAQEHRAREISKGLRCVVCQNQSIDDSDAQIASDIRKLVRERIVAGDSDQQIRDRLVDYYGEFVLLRPQFSMQNLVIWLAGPLALVLGLIWFLRRTGRTRPAGDAPVAPAEPQQAPLSEAERKRLAELLRE